MMGSKTGKKPQIPSSVKLALKIVPLEQANRRDYVECSVSNHSDEDQKDAVSLKRLKTIRKKTRISRLLAAHAITEEHARACEWYAAAHEYGYQTIGCTANYSGMSGHGFGPKDLFARHRFQAEARADYIWARLGLPLPLIPLFEKVVLNGDTLDEAGAEMFSDWGTRKRAQCLSDAFKEAADRLVARLDRIVAIAA